MVSLSYTLPSSMSEIVSRETMERLETYANLLLEWNPHINLISRDIQTLETLWHRHIVDCLQLLLHIPMDRSDTPYTIVDMGSGGGLPGAILAIARPHSCTHLIEADQKKAAFLLTVADRLALKPEQLTVHNKRVEHLTPWPTNLITARAFAPLPKLCEYLYPFTSIQQSCFALLMKGRNLQQELDEAAKAWIYKYRSHTSITDAESAIVEIHQLTHAV